MKHGAFPQRDDILVGEVPMIRHAGTSDCVSVVSIMSAMEAELGDSDGKFPERLLPELGLRR